MIVDVLLPPPRVCIPPAVAMAHTKVKPILLSDESYKGN